ncbi:MAG: alpha/beta hydrolase [Lentisphaeria bacterium]|nr:alpha/beta hydrolase [Lentisphaeria bacterium]
MRQTAGYMEVAGQWLYATEFLPAAGNGMGVVLFEPFGEEKKCALRMLVRLARACVEEGFAVLRFDLSGTGESSGEHGEATWEAWCREAEAAAQYLRTRHARRGWCALGTRLGAILALRAALSAGAAAVSLIEPVPTGSECLRDLERRQQIKRMMGGGGATGAAGASDAWARGGTADFGGYEVGAVMARELEAEDLSLLVPELPAACALQVLRVSGGKAFPPAWQALVERARLRAPGEALVIRDKPFWGQLEYYESDDVIGPAVAFLEAVAGASSGPDAGGGVSS